VFRARPEDRTPATSAYFVPLRPIFSGPAASLPRLLTWQAGVTAPGLCTTPALPWARTARVGKPLQHGNVRQLASVLSGAGTIECGVGLRRLKQKTVPNLGSSKGQSDAARNPGAALRACPPAPPSEDRGADHRGR